MSQSVPTPAFSVVVRADGADAALAATLRSVRRQVWREHETIIVSTDRTIAVKRMAEQELPGAAVLRVRAEAGAGTAWNAGLAAATGRDVAFLEQGDIWHTRYLHTCASVRASAAAEALFTFCDYYVSGTAKAGPVRQLAAIGAQDALEQMLLRPFVHSLSTLTAPRAAVLAIGGFNTGLAAYHHIDLPLRLLAGPAGRTRLACEDRSATGIPQVLVMLGGRRAAARPAGAGGGLRGLVESVFGYEFMARHAGLRRRCEMALQSFAAELSTGRLALP